MTSAIGIGNFGSVSLPVLKDVLSHDFKTPYPKRLSDSTRDAINDMDAAGRQKFWMGLGREFLGLTKLPDELRTMVVRRQTSGERAWRFYILKVLEWLEELEISVTGPWKTIISEPFRRNAIELDSSATTTLSSLRARGQRTTVFALALDSPWKVPEITVTFGGIAWTAEHSVDGDGIQSITDILTLPEDRKDRAAVEERLEQRAFKSGDPFTVDGAFVTTGEFDGLFHIGYEYVFDVDVTPPPETVFDANPPRQVTGTSITVEVLATMDFKKLEDALAEVIADQGIDLDPEDTSDQAGKRKRVGCSVCGVREAKGKCGECRARAYCSEECQAKDWPTHLETCSSV